MKKTGGTLLTAGLLLTGYLLTACVQTDNTAGNLAPAQDAQQVDAQAIVKAHNQWRADVNVPSLKWSNTLAGVAQSWADELKNDDCGFYHSGNGYGENIYKATPIMWSDGRRELQQKTPKHVTDSWGNEIKDYDYTSNSCSGVCGHYTQVVWKDTKEVGCAMSVCGDKSQIWVCSYAPAGNVVGKRPY